jgi:hypothetical protein
VFIGDKAPGKVVVSEDATLEAQTLINLGALAGRELQKLKAEGR